MDKSKVCITRAMKLNLASPCSKKQNLLVYDKRDPCYVTPKRKEFYTVMPLSSPAAKKIKVCTGADLKRMCKPKLCNCRPKKRAGPLQCFARLIGTTFKAGLAGALVYWTYEMGLWGPPTQTEQIYYDMCHAVCESTVLDPTQTRRRKEKLMESCPALKDAICPKDFSVDSECCKHPPNFEQAYYKMTLMWNKGVTCFFDFLTNAPQRIEEFWTWANGRYEKLVTLRDEKCDNEDKVLAKCKINRS